MPAGSAAVSLAFLLLGALVILAAGTRLVVLADRIADRTGLGEAVTGALLLGGMTSLPGLAASVMGAATGHAEMAVSNAVGGIAAQTVFLVVADAFHRPANLEHAAASGTNLFQASLLIGLLALPLLAANNPLFHDWWVHPVSVLMVAVYVVGLRIASRVRREAMWRPKPTSLTEEDVPDDRNRKVPLGRLMAGFVVLGAITAGAGWLVGRAGIGLIEQNGWDEGFVGGIFTAIASSLPELVTTIAAVRRGAYTLAVSGIVGGNAFDTLFVAASDAAYRQGSIYHAMGDRQEFLLAAAIIMTAVLLAGLIRRERHGVANIGMEGVAMLAIYALVLWVLVGGG